VVGLFLIGAVDYNGLPNRLAEALPAELLLLFSPPVLLAGIVVSLLMTFFMMVQGYSRSKSWNNSISKKIEIPGYIIPFASVVATALGLWASVALVDFFDPDQGAMWGLLLVMLLPFLAVGLVVTFVMMLVGFAKSRFSKR
jgi:heme/copper-type cytochrome/quinol oxidase subunit 2